MNILNEILINWKKSDFNDSGIIKISDIKNKIRFHLVYTRNKPGRIKIFDGIHWTDWAEFRDKVYINNEHVKLYDGGTTVNEYEAGKYQVYIDGFDKIKKTGFCAFDHCVDLTSVTIPNSVTIIDWCSFRGCAGLTSITIPNSVTTIGIEAFADCTSLTSITIPNSVTTINNYTFSGCVNLTSITIPNSVNEIGHWAFGNCKNLKTVYVEDLDKFNEIKFGNEYSDPTCYGAKLIELKK